MTELKEDSLVKRFGKKSTVIVDICGDRNKAFARDMEKQASEPQKSDKRQEIVQEMLMQQREASMDR